MLVIELTEHEFRPNLALPDELAALLTARFAEMLDVTPAWTAGHYKLRAGPFVGVVSLPGLTVRILPKVPLTNLFAMLTLAYDLVDLRPEPAAFQRLESLFEFLVDIFASQVQNMLRRGLYRASVEIQDNIPLIRGQIRFADHLRQNRITRHRHVCRFTEVSVDIAENQILYLACAWLARLHYEDDWLAGRLRRLTHALAQLGVGTPAMSGRWPRSYTLPEIVFHRLNSHYRPTIHLARLLLDMAGLEPAEGEEPFFSFLIDMNRLFERYIAQLLARDLPMVGLEVDLQPRLPLDQAGQVPIRPDIVIRQAGRPILVVDTKYKRLAEGQVEQPDLFQVLAYCRALLIDQAMLIYPAAGATERTIRVRDGASVVEMVFFTLDGSLAELQAEEGRLVAEVTIRQADQPR